MMTPQDICHRTGALEILLHQAQAFTGLMIIIGIEYFGEFGGVDALLFRFQKLTVVKQIEIKWMRMSGLPKAQRLGNAVAIAHHRQIPGFAAQGKLRFPARNPCSFLTIFPPIPTFTASELLWRNHG